MSYGNPGVPTGPQPGFPQQGFPKPGFPQPAPQKSGGGVTVVIVIVVVGVLAVVCVGIGLLLIALLLPAIQAARTAAARSANSVSLKEIGLAFHNYHDVYKTFPPAYIPDESGQPRTSWRAMLLPYVSDATTNVAGGSYNFSVAWNAPENSALRGQSMSVYNDLSTRGTNKTAYVAITGPGTAFVDAQGSRFSNFLDGTSNSILVVQIKNSDIEWPEPRDLHIDSLSTDPNGVNVIDIAGGALVLMADGAVYPLPRDMSLQALRDYLTIQDGKQVPMLY